jgi:hypothetical protein
VRLGVQLQIQLHGGLLEAVSDHIYLTVDAGFTPSGEVDYVQILHETIAGPSSDEDRRKWLLALRAAVFHLELGRRSHPPPPACSECGHPDGAAHGVVRSSELLTIEGHIAIGQLCATRKVALRLDQLWTLLAGRLPWRWS